MSSSYSTFFLIKTFSRYIRQNQKEFVLVVLLTLLMTVITVTIPVLISKGIDIVLGTSNQNSLFVILIFGMIFLHLFQWAINYANQLVMTKFITEIVVAIRNDAFMSILNQHYAWFEKQRSGDLMSRIVNDTSTIGSAMSFAVNLMTTILLVAFGFIILFQVSLELTLIAIAVVPLAIGIGWSFHHVTRQLARKIRAVLGKLNAQLYESMKNISTAKIFRQESLFFHEFDNLNQQFYKSSLKHRFSLIGITPVVSFFEGLTIAILLYMGSLRVIANQMSAGTLYLFIQMVSLFLFPLFILSIVWNNIQSGLSASERLMPFIRPMEEKTHDNMKSDKKHTTKIEINGRIEFKNVYFSYKEEEAVLNDFNLLIEPGETVALVGESGVGKSSVVKILLRFYEIQKGQILIDGHDLRNLDLSSYYQQIGVILQDPFIFHGTILENIKSARLSATEEEVMTALKEVGLDRWVKNLPQGINTILQEGGKNLSIGFKQLIEIARIALKKPKIIILDEPTASLDPFTQMRIKKALKKITSGKTTIIIAHQLHTIRTASRIIVLKDGRVIEEGTHNELVSKPSYYQTLYNKYFLSQI